MVTVVDYGIGNLRSIEKAIESVGVRVLRTDEPQRILEATHLVLPGVGAFGACAGEIRNRGLEETVRAVANRGTPFLGVCVGMQLLFDTGEEMGIHRGLGLLPGKVARFTGPAFEEEASHDGAVTTTRLKVPHMGWNSVEAHHASALLDGIPEAAFFYFVHSYRAVPDHLEDVLASTPYGESFPSVMQRNNVYGVQFHPEKSQRNGLRILYNFSRLPSP